MEIHLDLSRHCIETAARLKVEGLIRSYFKAPEPFTEDRIAALTRFLEQADFQDLRTRIDRRNALAEGPENTRAILIFSKALDPLELCFKKNMSPERTEDFLKIKTRTDHQKKQRF